MNPEEPKMVGDEQNWLMKLFGGGAGAGGAMGGMSGGSPMGAAGGLASGLGSALSGGPQSSQYNSGMADTIPAGTLTSLGGLAGPVGMGIGAAGDVALSAFTGYRKAKKKAKKEQEAKQQEAWKTMANAGMNRNAMEQEAISRMMNIGR